MTVQELIDILSKLPKDKRVFMTSVSGEISWVQNPRPEDPTSIIVIGTK